MSLSVYKETVTDTEIRRELAQQAKRAGSNKVLAARMKVSAAYLGEVIKGHKPIGPKILKYLRLRRVYEPIQRSAS